MLESAIARRPDRWPHAATDALYIYMASCVFLGVILAVVLLISGMISFLPLWQRSPAGRARRVLPAGGGHRLRLPAVGRHGPRRRGVHPVPAGPGPTVDVYDLAEVSLIEIRGLGAHLRLADRRNGMLTAPCGLLEGNQVLWDLVYNGIRHSVVNGATIDDASRRRPSLG